MASRNGTSESRDVEVNAAASESASSPSPQRELGRDDAPKLDLFVGNLSLYTEAASLKEYFERFGEVKDVRIMYHNDTGRSRRFGFVTFEDPETLEAVIKFPGGHDVDGKKIETNHAIRRGKDNGTAGSQSRAKSRSSSVPPIHKVFVGGIGQDTTENDLIAYFAAFGKISNATLLLDPQTGRHRGFAFVSFDDESSAEVVCAKRYHQIGGKTAEAKRAQQQAMARNASGAGQVATLGAGRRSRTSGPVRDPSASPAPAAATAGAHNPLQVAFTNAALSIAFVLQQNMVRQQQQITLMNSFAASQQFQSAAATAGVFPLPGGHIQQQPQQPQESLYPLQPLLAAPAVAAALPQPSPAPILGSVGAQLPQQQSYFVHAGGHPLQGGDLYAAMTAQTSPYIEALPAPATVVLPKTDCNANNNVQL